jgi:predicted Zn-dependent protease
MRKITIFAVVMATVALGGWVGRKAYKRATERRLLAQARAYMEKQDLRHCVLCLQRTLQVNPLSAPAAELMADFAESQGVAASLSWRIRAAKLDSAKSDYRLAWASTAIKLQDFNSAEEALTGLKQKDKGTAAYHKLAGALAWGLKNGPEAEREYNEALRLEPTNLTVTMNLATIQLSSTNAAIASTGRATLESICSNTTLRVTALHLLETEALSRKSFPEAFKYARTLAEGPDAGFADRVDYLQVLRAGKDSQAASYLAELKQAAATNSMQAFELGRWMVISEGATNTLSWLKSLPMAIQTNMPVPRLVADCMVALNDWNPLLVGLDVQDWGASEYYRFALQSLAHSSLNQERAAAASWQKAARLASHRLDALSYLARLSIAWGWKTESESILSELTSEFPKEKWAAGLLETEYYREGNTRALAVLLARVYASDPSDPKLENDFATVSLLCKSDLEKAHRLAREAYHSAPENPFFASTYAYSLLLQEKRDEAVKVISSVRTNFLQIPSVAAYYGVVQANSGHKELAREPLKLAGQASLLPEEKEMVRLAQNQL